MDVSHKMIHENIEIVCAQYGMAISINGRKLYLKWMLGFITEYLQKIDIVKRCIWDVDEKEGDVGEVIEGTMFAPNSTWVKPYMILPTNMYWQTLP